MCEAAPKLAAISAGAIARPKSNASWVLGSVLTAAFIPTYVQIRNKFPVRYDLTFLLTLAPIVARKATVVVSLGATVVLLPAMLSRHSAGSNPASSVTGQAPAGARGSLELLAELG